MNQYKNPAQQVLYSLQTNGTRLDEAWCRFFKKNNFLIGLSVDGTIEMHNAYRLNHAGKGSFDQAIRGWELLREHGVDTNILCAVHPANADRPLDTYHFFRDTLKAQFIQFIPIVERLKGIAGQGTNKRQPVNETGSVSLRSVGVEQYGRFLIEIFDEWVHHDVGRVFVQSFETALASWCHLPSSVCLPSSMREQPGARA